MSTASKETYIGDRLHMVRDIDTIVVRPVRGFVPVVPGANPDPSEITEPSEPFLSLARKIDSGTITPEVFKSRLVQDLDISISKAIKGGFASIIDPHTQLEETKQILIELLAQQRRSGQAREELSALSRAANAEMQHMRHEDERLALLQNTFAQFTDTLSSIPKSSNPIIFYEDRFVINGHQVIRHGINPDNDFMTTTISKFNRTLEVFNASNSSMPLDSATSADQSDTASVASTRSRPGSKKVATSYTKEALLHPAELYNLHKAISFLKSMDGSHAVVVDILVRDPKSCLIDEKSDKGHAEIHAIVLYKNANGDIIIIDPNNSEYSEHVAAYYNSTILCEMHVSQFKIGSPNNKTPLKIFVNATHDLIINDCVDIATKMAADLIAKKPTLTPVTYLQAEQLKSLFAKILTTPKEFNDHIPNGARILITSDDTVRNCAHKHVHGIIDTLRAIKHKQCAYTENYNKQLTDILFKANENYEYSECILNLEKLQKSVDMTIVKIYTALGTTAAECPCLSLNGNTAHNDGTE